MAEDLSTLKSKLEGNLIEEKVNENLEEKVQEGLDNLPEGEPKEDEELPAPEEEEIEEEKPKEEPVLPDNYYRAAKHQGWTDDEIVEFFDKDPEKALKTFGKIYESTNFITSQTAALGRTYIQTQKNLEEGTKTKSQPKVMDVEKLRQRIGDDDPASLALLDAMIEQNAILAEQISEVRKNQGTSRPVQMTDEESRIWDSINTFFNEPDIQLYGDLYGKTKTNKDWGTSLTGEQTKSRMTLIEQADQIRAGAMLQGKNIDYSEALQRAHLVVSDSMKEKVVRTKIVGELKRRNDGITVQSTVQKQRSQEDVDEGPPSLKKATATVKKGLKKFFGGYVE